MAISIKFAFINKVETQNWHIIVHCENINMLHMIYLSIL